MTDKYSAYKVEEGKEMVVEGEKGKKYCGDYSEDLIFNNEGLAVGLYDDPIRGENEIATINEGALLRKTCITGESGYGKSNLISILQSQLKPDRAVIDFDYKGDREEESYDKVVESVDFSFIFDYNNVSRQVELTSKQISSLLLEVGDSSWSKSWNRGINLIGEGISKRNISSMQDVSEFLENETSEEYVDSLVRRVSNAGDMFEFGEGEKLDFKNVIENKENILIKPNTTSEVKASILTKIIIQELYKYQKRDPVFVIIDNADFSLNQTIEKDNKNLFTNWQELISTSRGERIGMLFSFQKLDQLNSEVRKLISANVPNWILFRQTNESTAQRMAQKLNMSGQELQELDPFEAYLTPITPDGNRAEINVKAKTFPMLKPETREKL